MQDIINICVVNFHATCMDKESNINRIYGFIRAAAKRGADLVLFPEMCVNGYDFYDCKTNRFYNTPESVDGEFAHNILELAKKHEIIIVLGMAEEDDKTSKIYNSALVVSPQGIHGCYRKIHPFGDENLWCSKGEMPFMLESEFGKIGIGICYDTYQFPELIRYYTHKGMRLYLNPTALIYEVSKSHYEDAFLDYYLKTLGYAVMCNSIFVASANLVGRDRENFFAGGSCVLGVKTTPFFETQAHCYCGSVSENPLRLDNQVGMSLCTLDLSLATRRLCVENPHTKKPDYRNELYAKWQSDDI